MPKVVSYTPAWLEKPNPGHALFTGTAPKPASTQSSYSNGLSAKEKRVAKAGPRKTIAHRGTEVFIAVGREIRWGDLVYIKEAWEDQESKKQIGRGKSRDVSNQYDGEHAQGYRTIKTQAAEDIRQLIISPHEDFVAILTTHTVHIAVLPEPSQLTALDTGPIKLRSYTLGPTTHVTSQAGIASALWHPLGVNGTCVVTVTNDAVVRVWELSTADRWSFDRPTLAIDLKKLADGTSVDQDFGASVAGSKGFSPDSFEMDVASACFAGRGSGGWSPMTLWIAMREGDIYALCPLLPQKWSPPPTLIPSLSVSIVAKVGAMEDDPEVSQNSRMLAQQQLAWMGEIDLQEPVSVDAPGGGPAIEVYSRPTKPGRVPRLQGPFELDLAPEESEDELDTLLSDIYVIGSRIDSEELMFGEEDEIETDDVDQEGLSVGIICTVTSSGRLSVCLDLDGVEAQWLPKSKSKALRLLEEVNPPSLLTFEVLDTLKNTEVWEGNWPVFSYDANSRYSFYITDTSSITFATLTPWVFRLENELNGAVAGSDFRLNLLVKGDGTTRERIHTQKPYDRSAPLAASTLIVDPDLGYFLLSATPYDPVSVTFENPDSPFDMRAQSSVDDEEVRPAIWSQPRAVFQPAHTLDSSSAVPAYLDKLAHGKYKRLMKEEVRLSPATLQIMTEAHKVLSEETHRIGHAAAEVFRRCAQLQDELKEQIKKANEAATRIEALTGADTEDGPVCSIEETIENRIQEAIQRQSQLNIRIDDMKRSVARSTSRELSEKEKSWIFEVKKAEVKVIGAGNDEGNVEGNASKVLDGTEPWARYEEVKTLKEDLFEQLQGRSVDDSVMRSPNVAVPSELRKAKMGQIMGLLDRESALVEGTKTRLERLSLI